MGEEMLAREQEPQEQFDVKGLRVGDRFRGAHWRDYEVLYVHPEGVLAEVMEGDHPYGIYPHFLGWNAFFAVISNHLTCVQRPDSSGKLVQIWPLPQPKFKVGDEVLMSKHRSCGATRIVSQHFGNGPTTSHRKGKHWWYRKSNGCWDRENSLELAPPECPFKVGQMVRGKGLGAHFGSYSGEPFVIELITATGRDWECWADNCYVLASWLELAPPEPWQPAVGEWVEQGGNIGIVLAPRPETSSTNTFSVAVQWVRPILDSSGFSWEKESGLRPYAPPLEDVAEVIYDHTHGIMSSGAAHDAAVVLGEKYVFVLKNRKESQA